MTTLVLGTRAQAATWCALLGDALGVPYEFHGPSALPRLEAIDMSPPAGFVRSHRGTPEGTWSDDGAQLLALFASLRRTPTLDLADFGSRLLGWYRRGDFTPDGRVFDVGMQTSSALSRIERGVSPMLSDLPREDKNGNGSLMRVLPVAFLHVTAEEAVRVARLQSLPTHAHVRAQLCCALYVLLVRELLGGAGKHDAMARAQAALTALVLPQEHAELHIVLQRPSHLSGGGYVLDSLWSAWAAFEMSDTVEGCLRRAVARGNDTDTTACIAGGLVGAYVDLQGVPERWLSKLRGKDLVQRLFDSLSPQEP